MHLNSYCNMKNNIAFFDKKLHGLLNVIFRNVSILAWFKIVTYLIDRCPLYINLNVRTYLNTSVIKIMYTNVPIRSTFLAILIVPNLKKEINVTNPVNCLCPRNKYELFQQLPLCTKRYIKIIQIIPLLPQLHIIFWRI